MDEGKDAGLPHKPVEEQVSTLVDKKDRETWEHYSRCALYQKWEGAKDMLTEYTQVVNDLRKATGSFERDVTRIGKLNSKLEGIIVGLQDDKVKLKVQIGRITNSN